MAARGVFITFEGGDGSGKSTLLTIMGGLRTPSSGTVTISGQPFSSLPEKQRARLRLRRIGFVLQASGLVPFLRLNDQFSLHDRAARTQGDTARRDHLLDSLGITKRAHAYPSELSGGERQRAAIAVALYHDPDIILVGELRDLETIRLALTAAETGHLVFGTLHTSSAAKTIDRIVDVFPAAEKDMVRAMLSESLKAVISQTLLKTKDGNGRVAAHEIMIGTPAIRNLIREAKVSQMNAAIQTGGSQGMQTLDQCLTDLVRKNVISMAEARAAAAVKENFPL